MAKIYLGRLEIPDELKTALGSAGHLVLAAEVAIQLRAESNAIDLCRQALQEIRRPRLTPAIFP